MMTTSMIRKSLAALLVAGALTAVSSPSAYAFHGGGFGGFHGGGFHGGGMGGFHGGGFHGGGFHGGGFHHGGHWGHGGWGWGAVPAGIAVDVSCPWVRQYDVYGNYLGVVQTCD